MVVLRHVVLFITLCLLVFTLLVAPGTYTKSSEDTLTNEQPIAVAGDSNFSSAYWHGDGSASSPYILENVAIATNISCVSISNTSSYFIIRNCWFRSYWYGGYGIGYPSIALDNATNGVIQDCHFDSSITCLALRHCSNINLTGNTLTSEIFGIIVSSSLDCSVIGNQLNRISIEGTDDVSLNISDNIITNSRQDSIELHNVSYSYVARNSILHSHGDGLFIVISAFTTVSHNIISDSGAYGILASTFNCTFVGNTIENSQSYGVDLTGSGNVFSVNLFFNNTFLNARDRGRQNTWEGNYWDDYVGLGPYPVDGTAGSQDPHPQSYPGILTPMQIILIVLIPIAVLVVLYVIRKRRV